MGYKHKLNKDFVNSKFFLKNELNCVMLSYFNKTVDLDYFYKCYFFYKFLNSFHLNSSSSSMVNSCMRTGSANWCLSKYKLSSITFKEFADKAYINGVSSATW